MKTDCWNPKFSHIYVEERVWDHERTQKILKQFPRAQVIRIGHYKDLFNRKHQNFQAQHDCQALILAKAEGNSLYPGAKVCQSFGFDHFYYTSNVYNCLFDCEYCYLKGMYPSGNMVIFVNIEDVFKEVEELLSRHPLYLCVSYDTDLCAMEDFTGFVRAWNEFTLAHDNLWIEIRTKSARTDLYETLKPCKRVIFAYTISPEHVAAHYEHGSGSMEARILAAKTALEHGFALRLCFDPMIYCPDWEKEYGKMVRMVVDQISLNDLADVSVGSFRISQDYMKQMRKNFPDSPVVQFPYENVGGVYQYPEGIRKGMEQFLVAELCKVMPREKIFLWEENTGED